MGRLPALCIRQQPMDRAADLLPVARIDQCSVTKGLENVDGPSLAGRDHRQSRLCSLEKGQAEWLVKRWIDEDTPPLHCQPVELGDLFG